jgi:putative ABC transport system ATP-binding protein
MDTRLDATLVQDTAVAIAGVSHAFNAAVARTQVLVDVDLTLRRGEFAILTGPSGAGKTTLMTLVGALRSLQRGSIRIHGTELWGLSDQGRRGVRRGTGFIFQDHNLFEALTVSQTLRLAMELRERRPSSADALAQSSAILDKLGMNEHLHARPRALSTGQKQRVAIARALINEPRLILADEPTASLDSDASSLVIRLLQYHASALGATILMVTHDDRLFTAASRVIRMENGRIVSAS